MNIQHKRTHGGIFFIESDNEQVAELEYIMNGETNMVIMHTGVREKLEGQGVGKKLVEAAVEFARQNNFKIKALCPFAAKVLSRSEAYKDILI